MSNPLLLSLFAVCLALLACLHFALQVWLNGRERARAKAKGLFEPKPGLNEEPPSPSPPRYRMPLSLIIFMIFTVTYYGLLLIVMIHYA